jgi:dipeptidase
MCDTLVALGNSTADGSVILAKNSDREPNEAHELVVIPHASHPAGSTVRCTYIELPQVVETFAVLLAKPFWIWGAEMGANEKGVAIGNESVFTKVPMDKKPGLIGMDFLRLALERAATARAALDVIVSLLETYGQSGNCGLQHPTYYHNSFLIADPHEAWVLETAGKHWAAVKVKDVYSISNAITIDNEWDLASSGLVDYAVERGWCKSRQDFSFARCYTSWLYTHFSQAQPRQCRSTALLHGQGGQIDIPKVMSYLRDHGEDATPEWSPVPSLRDSDVCMHAGFGPVRISQSVGSMVSHLTPGVQTHWLTGMSAPCTGTFKPVWIDSGLPELGPSPKAVYDDDALWWRHESLHRAILRDYTTRLARYQPERDALEAEFIRREAEMHGKSTAERRAFSADCFTRSAEATAHWTAFVQNTPIQNRTPVLFSKTWARLNKQARVP